MEYLDNIIDEIKKIKSELEDIDSNKFYETIYHLQLGLHKLNSIKKNYAEI